MEIHIIQVGQKGLPSFVTQMRSGTTKRRTTLHVVVKIQVTGEAKASPTLDKLEIYGDGPGRPLDSSHVDLCLILLRC